MTKNLTLEQKDYFDIEIELSDGFINLHQMFFLTIEKETVPNLIEILQEFYNGE